MKRPWRRSSLEADAVVQTAAPEISYWHCYQARCSEGDWGMNFFTGEEFAKMALAAHKEQAHGASGPGQ